MYVQKYTGQAGTIGDGYTTNRVLRVAPCLQRLVSLPDNRAFALFL